MSLQTDIIFYRAIVEDEAIVEATGGRIYNTAIPLPDEQLNNVPAPYVVITYDGMSNDPGSKDDPYEGITDTVQIGIEVVANNRNELADLTKRIRTAVHDFFCAAEPLDEDFVLVPDDYAITASPVQYDQYKPAYWQQLRYSCSTENETLNVDES